MMRYKTEDFSTLGLHLLGAHADRIGAYSFDCTFFRLICLTAKALLRMTMRGFLVGTTESKKRTLKRVQLRFLG